MGRVAEVDANAGGNDTMSSTGRRFWVTSRVCKKTARAGIESGHGPAKL